MAGSCCAAGPLQWLLGGGSARRRTWVRFSKFQLADTLSFQQLLPNRSGCHPEDTYDISQDRLGAGTYGTVKTVVRKGTTRARAMKTMAKDAIPNVAAFQNEIFIQMSLDHPNVVRIFDVFEDPLNVYIVMELCLGGELMDVLAAEHQESFTEPDARVVMRQVLHAVCYMHEKGITHRDLKPENFLVKERGVPVSQTALLVADFGMSQFFVKGQKSLKTKCGTCYYLAPEIMKGPYDESCDVWSCGAILHLLLSGMPPFDGETDEDIIEKAATGDLNLHSEAWFGVSPNAKLMVVQMMKLDAAKRPTAVAALESFWMLGGEKAEETEETGIWTQNVMSQLKFFSKSSKFKKRALRLIAHCTPYAQLRELREAFLEIDTEGHGSLYPSELVQALDKVGVDAQQAQSLFDSLDEDHHGRIDYTEFLASMLSEREVLDREACREAFRVMDRNGDGVLSRDELRALLAEGQHGPSERELEEVMDQVDRDGDHSVDFEEFLGMLGQSRRSRLAAPPAP